MKILFVMDPVETCDPRWDNSLYLLSEFAKRGHENWTADGKDLELRGSQTFVTARLTKTETQRRGRIEKRIPLSSKTKRWRLQNFDLILIRKDPPFDDAYKKFTKALQPFSKSIPIANDPAGILHNNEKLSILNFPQWIPKTCVSPSPDVLMDFHKKLRRPMVVKPLEEKGGKGVFLLRKFSLKNRTRLVRATAQGTRPIMVQAFIPPKGVGEKRMVLLHGDLLAVYRKQPKGKEFRGNLGLGASFHPCGLTPKEKRMIRDLKPFLRRQKLYFAGIDTVEEKLIEINVTSPAGITEAKFLYPQRALVEAWADFLEGFSRRRRHF